MNTKLLLIGGGAVVLVLLFKARAANTASNAGMGAPVLNSTKFSTKRGVSISGAGSPPPPTPLNPTIAKALPADKAALTAFGAYQAQLGFAQSNPALALAATACAHSNNKVCNVAGRALNTAQNIVAKDIPGGKQALTAVNTAGSIVNKAESKAASGVKTAAVASGSAVKSAAKKILSIF